LASERRKGYRIAARMVFDLRAGRANENLVERQLMAVWSSRRVEVVRAFLRGIQRALSEGPEGTS
jgi:hypothetical protein